MKYQINTNQPLNQTRALSYTLNFNVIFLRYIVAGSASHNSVIPLNMSANLSEMHIKLSEMWFGGLVDKHGNMQGLFGG